ncbi:MAG: hypothetical protein P4L31_00945 [Candidatus Babeliales bacterium]|nr:hypothetical protein [Candidatus Babeliales bacterium]
MNKLIHLLFCMIALATLPAHGMHRAASIAAHAKTSLVKQVEPLIATQSFHLVRGVPKDKCYRSPFETERKKFDASLKSRPWGSVASKYFAHFHRENHAHLSEFCTLLPHMTPIKWHMHKHFLKAPFEHGQHFFIGELKHSTKEIPPVILDKAKRLTQKVGINPDVISYLYDEKSKGYMQAGQKALYICNDAGAILKMKNNKKALDGLILHELQHILHDDVFLLNCVKHMCFIHKKSIDKEVAQAFIKKISHLREKRADICAGLTGPQYAKGLIKLFGKFNDPQSSTHPAMSERTAYMKKLHEEMLDAIKKN